MPFWHFPSTFYEIWWTGINFINSFIGIWNIISRKTELFNEQVTKKLCVCSKYFVCSCKDISVAVGSILVSYSIKSKGKTSDKESSHGDCSIAAITAKRQTCPWKIVIEFLLVLENIWERDPAETTQHDFIIIVLDVLSLQANHIKDMTIKVRGKDQRKVTTLRVS